MTKINTFLLVCGALGLAACAGFSHFPAAEVPNAASLQRALSGELLLETHWQAEQLPNLDLFLLTPEMQAFAEQAVSRKRHDFGRAEALQRALLLSEERGGIGLTYSTFSTKTPVEAFTLRRVNCVSFTFMYVAMARYVGLNAHINEVDLPPSWDLRNRDAFLFLRHVNAKVQLRGQEEAVIDLEMDRYSPAYKQRFISEELAAAQFYNNRGMELAAEGKMQESFLYLRKALLLDDRQSYIWSNFATLYRRLEFFPEAEAAYLFGLQLDPEDLTIMTNLSGVYRRMGDQQKADYYYQRAEKHRARNPYYRYSEASYALDAGQLDTALTLIRQAIAAHKKEMRFYTLAAEIYTRMGDTQRAQQMQLKAERLHIPYVPRN